ncbi:MAG: acyl-CoA dehydrogenase family protein, partial [Acetobacteraceae bacterium]
MIGRPGLPPLIRPWHQAILRNRNGRFRHRRAHLIPPGLTLPPAAASIAGEAGGSMEQSAELREALRMVRDSAAAVVPRGDLRRIRALRFTDPGFDRATWRQICNLGWPALALPESEGGSGLGMRGFAALAEELGAGLVPEPLIQAAMAARALSGAPLADLLAGTSLVLPAWQERANSLDPAGETTLRDSRLSGRKLFVAMA